MKKTPLSHHLAAKFPQRNLLNYIFLAAAFFVLTSCAGVQSFKDAKKLSEEGKPQEAIAQYQNAIKQDPNNIEYKLALNSYKTSIINQYLSDARLALQASKLSDAEKAYRRVQIFDAHNVIAKNGLEEIVRERKHRDVISEAESLVKEGTLDKLNDADYMLRSVLAENPEQKLAVNLKARIDASILKLSKKKNTLSDVYAKPISLEFQDAPIKDVFDVISKVSNINFFFDKDIRPDLKVSILVKNTSLNDSIRLLLVTNQLAKKVLNENSILIYPNTPQKLKDYEELSVRSFYVVNADVKAVSTTLKTILKINDIVIDERLGLVIVRDKPEVIRAAEKLVALQDVGDSEVMLEVEILEIKRAKLLELGIQWPSQLTLTPLQVGGGAVTVETLKNLKSDGIQANVGNITINARKENQDSDILANPRIRVRNKQKAKILIGDRVPVITTTSTSTGFVSESITYVDVGLKLEVEPTIYLDEDVAINVNLEVSTIVREVLSQTGSLSYQIGTREATTSLRLKDGETQVLAGLINNEERATANKVPLLGELPIVGRLFKSQKDDAQRSEILLSITPRIIRSIKRPDLHLAEFKSGTDTYVAAEDLTLKTIAVEEGEVSNTKKAEKPLKQVVVDSPKTVVLDNTNKTAADVASQPKTVSNTTFGWKTPAEVKVGEQFSAVLEISSPSAIASLPMLIGFDPKAMQLVNVQEGDFFKQNNGQTRFNQRSDNQGKIFTSIIRQSTSAEDTGINGVGKVLTVTFKALKPSPKSGTKLQLLSADIGQAGAVKLPIEKTLMIAP